jgi:CcmD family protein
MITHVVRATGQTLLAWAASTGVAAAQQPGQGGFVPVGPGAVVEQLPAAPLVIAAYGFVWIALMVYLWSIWRRIGKVEADIRTLEQRGSPGSRR